MASKDEKDDLLLGEEVNAPELIKRFIRLFRKNKGRTARINSKKAHDWFYDNLKKRSELKAGQVMEGFDKRSPGDVGGMIGRLMLFRYNPKHANKLPYYDTAPLAFIFNAFVGDREFGEEGVLYLMGLNMHYLPPKMRLVIFRSLLTLRSEKRYRKSTRLKVTWQALKALANSPAFQHCVKMYRADHVVGEMAEIDPAYWAMVMFLPIAEFEKASNRKVWSDIGKK